MNIKMSLIMALQPLRLIIFAIFPLLLLSSGCDTNEQQVEFSLAKFSSEPTFTLNPNGNTPLAGELHVTSDIETRVLLDIIDDTTQWNIQFNSYAQNHILPVLGFQPGKTYTVVVHLMDRSNLRTESERIFTITTTPLPAGFPTLSTQSTPNRMEPGLTLFNAIPQTGNQSFGGILLIVNNAGEVVWYLRGPRFGDARRLTNGNLLFVQLDHIIEMDLLGNIINDWQVGERELYRSETTKIAAASVHHEVFPMQNGHFLLLSIEARNYDNYPIDAWDLELPTQPALVAGDVVVEYTAQGDIVNQWSMLDMIDPYRVGYGSLGNYWDSFFNTETKDWTHGNAVIHDPKDDSIIVSLRHQDAVIKFSRQSGDIKWILGPHENWNLDLYGQYLLTPVNNQTFFFNYHQHAPMILPNGNILLYDNGNYRASPGEPTLPLAENFSRAVEYSIDEQNKQVELVWEYGQFANNRVYCWALGDADALMQTGNVLITHGNINNANNKYSGRIIEVTRDTPAVEVFNLSISDASENNTFGWRIYRSERIADFYQ